MAQNKTKLIASEAARMLDNAKIPCILVGWLATNLAGVETNSLEVELVIPDDKLQAANAVFAAANFEPCRDSTCNELKVRRRRIESPERLHYHPVPAWHTHLDSARYTLSLFLKSDILWWLPDFPLGSPAANDPHLTVSTNPNLPLPAVSGQWGNLHPIKILNPNSFTEAAILLFCRNARHGERLGRVYSYMLAAMSESELTGDKSKKVTRHLRPEFQPAWDCLNGWSPEDTDPNSEMKRLRERLIARGALGTLPPEHAPGGEANKETASRPFPLLRELNRRRGGCSLEDGINALH
ncbi:hypothetical protein BJX63DRAFT_310239 [Aspergillus granulosus]|uniref:Uncharacterized protein n=1 Tax=Aspergillus granulosus TaxID=176169 RepID=A0ABR4HXP7_9EURO